MKLSFTQRQQALEQLTEEPAFEETVFVSENNPAISGLHNLFGEHTFLLADEGLHIIEPAGAGATATGRVIKVASWTNRDRTALMPHRPERTDVVVALFEDEEQ